MSRRTDRRHHHRRQREPRRGYLRDTHRPLNCLVFIAPLLLLFHVGTLWYGTNLLAPRDLGRLLRYFGATASFLPPLLIVATLLFQQALRREPWRVRPLVISGMMGESLVGMIPLIVIGAVVGRLLSAGGGPTGDALLREILVGVGAGVYEEFCFRLILISVLMAIFVDLLGLRQDWTAAAAVLVTAVLFSLYHFTGGQMANGAPFPWRDFVFYAIAGVYLACVFIFRGFGVAVGAHAFYNIYVAMAHM